MRLEFQQTIIPAITYQPSCKRVEVSRTLFDIFCTIKRIARAPKREYRIRYYQITCVFGIIVEDACVRITITTFSRSRFGQHALDPRVAWQYTYTYVRVSTRRFISVFHTSRFGVKRRRAVERVKNESSQKTRFSSTYVYLLRPIPVHRILHTNTRVRVYIIQTRAYAITRPDVL